MAFAGLTLLIPAKPDPERRALAQAWVDGQGSVLTLDRFWQPPALDPASVRVYGPETFCWVLAEKLSLRLISPPDDYLAGLDAGWLGRELEMTTLHRALHRSMAGDFPVFCKSLVPKLFRSRVYRTPDELENETRGLDGDTAVFVAEQVRFESEYRAFVTGSELCTMSCYEGRGDDREAEAFVARFLAANPLPVPAALDVGRIGGRGFAVIEANPAWGAGLNGCAAERAAPCIAAACRAR